MASSPPERNGYALSGVRLKIKFHAGLSEAHLYSQAIDKVCDRFRCAWGVWSHG